MMPGGNPPARKTDDDEVGLRSPQDRAGRTEGPALGTHALGHHVRADLPPERLQPVVGNPREQVVEGVMIVASDQPCRPREHGHTRIDVSALVAAQPSWSTRATDLAPVFGDLWSAVSPHARQNHASRRDLADRLRLVTDQWPSLMSGLDQILRSSKNIRDVLRSAACPVTFADLGVAGARARIAVLYSRHIRSRYTILDLLDELGLLSGW